LPLRHAARLSLLVGLAPLLLGATDARHDFFPCGEPTEARTQEVDIGSAQGQLIDDGTALGFTVTLAGAPPAPDPVGHPWRVDVLLRDPNLPAFSVGPYRHINRLLRFDATDPPTGTMLLLPEEGRLQPSTFYYRDGTVTMTVAGRLLIPKEEIRPSDLEDITWSVLARDEDRCDRLGGASPSLKLTRGELQPAPSPSRAFDEIKGGSLPVWTVVALSVGVLIVVGGLMAFGWHRARR
jgi:hypothetical protein